MCAFIPRARRVEVHSLAMDKEQLLRWARGSVDVQARSDGTARIRKQLPPEELLESLAVRVRPFILQKDPVHHAKVMTAIGWFVGSARESLRDVAQLRRSWADTDARRDEVRGFRAHVRNTASGKSASATDSHLALGWLYGDTVHADSAALEGTEMFGVDGRYEAAVPLVCQLAVRAIQTLNLIRHLQDQDLIAVPGHLFDDAVVAKSDGRWVEAAAYTAPVGADPPASPEGPLGPEWSRLGGPSDKLTADAMATPRDHRDGPSE